MGGFGALQIIQQLAAVWGGGNEGAGLAIPGPTPSPLPPPPPFFPHAAVWVHDVLLSHAHEQCKEGSNQYRASCYGFGGPVQLHIDKANLVSPLHTMGNGCLLSVQGCAQMPLGTHCSHRSMPPPSTCMYATLEHKECGTCMQARKLHTIVFANVAQKITKQTATSACFLACGCRTSACFQPSMPFSLTGRAAPLICFDRMLDVLKFLCCALNFVS